ncbi:MAG: hypothetical protein IT559_02665 [Alphaproteobacteria bacterium]|nr:hypothetical protein [Alphaproteobacteria bacterium]
MGWVVPTAFVSGLIASGAGALISRGFEHYANEASDLFAQGNPDFAALYS